LTVKENLAFPLEARGEPKARINERVEEVAKILDLVDVLDQKPAQISGGHQQRVSLGRCIIRKPRVFLFDEPLSHVDSEARRKMRGEVKRLQQMFKTTSVYVTHDQSEAMALADRISVMNLGEVQQTGTPNEIYHHPHNLFVADFIGEPPFNFFDCSVVSDGGQLAFRTQVGNHRILVPNTIKERMGDSLDRVLRVGVRPMYITPSLVEQEDSQIHGTVYVFEGLGEEGVLTVDVDGSLIRILTEPDFEGKPGDRVWLNVDSSRIQVFDPKTTNNVLSC
jgi:ABC-type sugar transport system ATPase subunit